MAKALKRMLVESYTAELSEGTGLIVVDPGPMTVEKVQEFRRDLREKAGGARLRVVHNRTAIRALDSVFPGVQQSSLQDVLSGPSAIAFGGQGAASIARVLRDWKRKFKPLRVKGGVSEGEVLDGKSAEALADLPDLPQVRAMVLSAVIGPARGIAASLQGVYGGLARCLQARVDAAGGEGTPAEGAEPGAA
jgi:large subunit ribosomal protein L10